MNYADLHCDTLTAAFTKKSSLKNSDTDVSLDKAACFDKYIQAAAIFTSPSLSDDEGYTRFLDVAGYAAEEAVNNSDILAICKSGTELDNALANGKAAWILSVEDARILSNDIARLDVLKQHGVRVLTPLWSGMTCIGGSFDSDGGLTDFGKAVIERCFDLSIVPDISHASVKSANEILTIAERRGKPVIASHSDSYSVCRHPRNLRDDQLKRIIALGGIVGLNMYPVHVSGNNCCTKDDIARHLFKYLSFDGGVDTVCFGCDFDGIEVHPDGVSSVSDIPVLVDTFRLLGVDSRTTEKISFTNAYGFLKNNLK